MSATTRPQTPEEREQLLKEHQRQADFSIALRALILDPKWEFDADYAALAERATEDIEALRADAETIDTEVCADCECSLRDVEEPPTATAFQEGNAPDGNWYCETCLPDHEDD